MFKILKYVDSVCVDVHCQNKTVHPIKYLNMSHNTNSETDLATYKECIVKLLHKLCTSFCQLHSKCAVPLSSG